MRPRLYCFVLAAFLLVPASAAAHTTVTCASTCSFPYQAWVDAFHEPTVAAITIEEGSEGTPGWLCAEAEYGGIPSCAAGGGLIPVDPSAIWTPRWVFAHELGHEFDAAFMSDQDRARFIYLARFPAGSPWQYPFAIQHEGPNEFFADDYATCAISGFNLGTELPGGTPGTRIASKRFFQICTLIERAYLRH
jgi:hypothetical protein